jgi:hypothetical protein
MRRQKYVSSFATLIGKIRSSGESTEARNLHGTRRADIAESDNQHCSQSEAPPANATSPHDIYRPLTLDEIIAARPLSPLTVQQLFEKWGGIFERESWEEVRRGRALEKPNGASAGQLLETENGRAIVPSMPLTPEELAEKAMELPTESRAHLADLLVESLDAAELSSIDRKWAAEAKRRRDEVRSGTVRAVPADEVSRKVRESLKR